MAQKEWLDQFLIKFFWFASQCLHQKSELEKKLSSLAIPGGASTESNILVKHLQDELRNYVSLSPFCYFVMLNFLFL